MIRVQREDFDVGAEIEALRTGNTAIGGIASFVGTVRDFAGDTPVTAMTLEHYPGMTERELERIEQEANERWPLEGSLIIHRYGRLELGDRIVLVVTASARRQAALESCAFLIDWLKTKAPFWKKEETPGGENWVDARDSDDAAAARWHKD
ncbi:MAG: molybdenum cofactor biosynthesis protein MoaE [Proteobacteria bacterium]|nr:molybdenum cofactor biosynthesis protein MoaE [Pseudomonadota bacterium]